MYYCYLCHFTCTSLVTIYCDLDVYWCLSRLATDSRFNDSFKRLRATESISYKGWLVNVEPALFNTSLTFTKGQLTRDLG